MLDLLHLDDLRFLHDLHGVEAVVMFRLRQVNTTETARTQRALQSKVFQRVLVLGDAIYPSSRLLLRLLTMMTLLLL